MLKEARIKAGLTQAELAKASGINIRIVQSYEQGARDLRKASIETCIKLAEALGITVYELLNWEQQ